MQMTPEQMASRLHELAQTVKGQAFARDAIAEGFELIAQAISPAPAPSEALPAADVNAGV